MARNEFKRNRVYYTKAQITDGLITEGGEWMFIDGMEYIGQYHSYSTGEVFSEVNFVDGKSRKLIPYVDVTTIGTQNAENMDFAKNFIYDEIKSVDIKKSKTPNRDIEAITDKDIKNGYMIRYFGYRYDDSCIELNKEKFNQIGSEDGLSGVVYKKLKIKWKITGPIHDVLDENGKVIESGVFDSNKRNVALISEKHPSIKLKLLDYTEFHQL